MALPEITNCFRCVASGGWTAGGDTWANVFHLGATSGTPTSADVLLAFFNAIEAGWKVHQVSQLTYTLETVTKLDGTSLTVEQTIGTSGGGSGSSVPRQCSAVISHHTALRGRSNRGRNYLAGYPASFVDATDTSTWSDSAVTTIQGDVAAFKSSLADSDMELLVASYKLASARPVTSTLADKDVFTQRRRVGRFSGAGPD